MSEAQEIQKRLKSCYGGKLIAHAHVDMTTLMEGREKVRQLLVKAACHCPSTNQCLQGEREILAANSRLALASICDALEVLTDSRGNFEGG